MGSIARRVVLACVFAVTCFAAGAWAAAQRPPQVQLQPPLVSPVVFSGADMGFRMTGRKGEIPIGELVVRENGVWKPVQFAMGPRPLSR